MDNYRFRDEIRFQIMEEFRKLKVIPKANPMWYNQAKCDIYMGSLNFTESGTKYNYETRVRVTDPNAIQEIDTEFDALFHDPDLGFFWVEEWGKSFYA